MKTPDSDPTGSFTQATRRLVDLVLLVGKRLSMKQTAGMGVSLVVGSIVLSSLLTSHARAGDVAVIDASIQCERSGATRVCSISATLKHDDTGWDHYADAWRVVTDDGTEIGRRVLMHPHENEQPFTRSESGIEIPEGVTRVYIEGQDNVHGLSSDNRFELAIPD